MKIARIVILIVATAQIAQAQELYVGKDGNIRNIDARAMILEGQNGYLATRSELYRTNEGMAGEKWEELFSLSAGENEISSMAISGKNILIGTRRGIYRSSDSGKSWRNVFRTIIAQKSSINSIDAAKHGPHTVIIGTMKGVFISEDFGLHWADISANLRNKEIRQAAIYKGSFYAIAEGGLFIRKQADPFWERVYVKSSSEESESDQDELSYSDDPDRFTDETGSISINEKNIIIGMGKKIKCSQDDGITWTDISVCGLSGSINYLLQSNISGRIYCATTKGVFELSNDGARWNELYKGAEKTFSASGLAFFGENEKVIWALTNRGLYRFEAGLYSFNQSGDDMRSVRTFRVIFDGEPSFAELRRAAIDYCDVSPDKIKSWQKRSRLKALVPKVSVGVGNDISSNTEIYTSATRDYFVTGPEDHSSNFDFSMSWDLGNMIWSSDQTSIDVRSRLNTQLRNDILDDLRRLYYERKRIQFELISSPPKDIRVRFDREMRVKELTDAIDDLTGNYLSEHTTNKTGGDIRNKNGGNAESPIGES